jgi:hypothetical protein
VIAWTSNLAKLKGIRSLFISLLGLANMDGPCV